MTYYVVAHLGLIDLNINIQNFGYMLESCMIINQSAGNVNNSSSETTRQKADNIVATAVVGLIYCPLRLLYLIESIFTMYYQWVPSLVSSLVYTSG